MTTLPTTDAERIQLGIVSAIMTFFSVFGLLALTTSDIPEFGLLFTSILMITEHLFLSMAIVFGMMLLWSIAMPAWVDWLFAFAWSKLFVVMGIAFLPIIVLLALAASGLKLGAGLNP